MSTTFYFDFKSVIYHFKAGENIDPFACRLFIGLPFAMSGFSELAAIDPTTEMIRAG